MEEKSAKEHAQDNGEVLLEVKFKVKDVRKLEVYSAEKDEKSLTKKVVKFRYEKAKEFLENQGK